MFAKLLEILLQSKSAAISAVFVIGTTGALVSATTQNGVTTVTVTQATQSPLASPTHTAPPTPSAAAAAPVDSTTGAGSDCSADAHARSAAVGDVNRTFATDVAALAKLAHNKGEKARQTAQTTDRLLMQIRASAVRAIEATNCDDNDESADEDSDEHDNEDEDADGADEHAAPATASGQITFTGTDPKAIADQAVAAMTLAFNTAKATLDALPTPTPHATRTPETRTSDHKSSDRGHDEHDGHDGDDD
jgi:hypothetical protein